MGPKSFEQASVGKLCFKVVKAFSKLLGPIEDLVKAFPGIFNLQSSVGKLLFKSFESFCAPLKIWQNLFQESSDFSGKAFISKLLIAF